MALKSKITKAEHSALSAELQAIYTVNPNNAEEFFLDAEDAKELRAANERNKAEADEAKRKLAEADAEKAKAAKAEQDAKDELARKAGDIAAIEKSWEAKVIAAKDEAKAEIAKLKKQIEDLTINVKVTALAGEISTVPELIEPLIRNRLKLELDGETAVIRVLDADGKASALSLDDLKKEFVANPKYASIIKANSASGGGAGPNAPGGGADKKFQDLTEQERVDWHKRDPNGFNAAAAADKAARR